MTELDDGLGPASAPVPAVPAPAASAREGRGSPVGRRVVLGMAGAGVAGVLIGARVQNVISDVLTPVTAIDPTGLTQLIPVADGFRIYTITDGYPSKSTADWKLTVGGLVDNPITITYDELLAMPSTDLVKDFQCVTGWRVPKVHWTGVLLSHILDMAGVQPAGKALSFHSFDNADTESLTLDEARRPDVIVAYRMLGAPVTREHGGPVRLYVAPMYGYKSLKWLDGITVTSEVIEGYWEQNGYDVDAWVGKSNGRDDSPTT